MPSFKPETAFEGYVVAKLEEVSNRLDALPCRLDSDRIRELEKNVSNINGKASVFGAITGFVAGLIAKLLMK